MTTAPTTANNPPEPGRMPRDALERLIALSGLPPECLDWADFNGSDPVFPTRYRVIAPGAAAIAAAGLAAAHLWYRRTGRAQQVAVDSRAAATALRSSTYLKIDGRRPLVDPSDMTGFYQTGNRRWIYLHCGFANLRDQNARVLGVTAGRSELSAAVELRDSFELEEAIMDTGGCASVVRTEAEWSRLPQHRAIARLPLLDIAQIGPAPRERLRAGDRPLSGVRVLDLTRVLAGPTCTRALAEHGADVLAVTRKGLPHAGLLDCDTGIGKLRTHLDLREPGQYARLSVLAHGCDVFCQSYRPGTLARRGFGPGDVAQLRPGVIYAQLSAWGSGGPWQDRRGFDSVIQAACGFASSDDHRPPRFLPYAALDYIAGYLLAFGVMIALGRRADDGGSWLVQTSLARVAYWIQTLGLIEEAEYGACQPELPEEQLRRLLFNHASPFGTLTSLRPAVRMSETPASWTRPSVPLGFHKPEWPVYP